MIKTMRIPPRSLPALLAALAAPLSLTGQETKVTFADHVLPILENKCVNCHNADESKGGLNLASFSATMGGGAGGSVVTAGDPLGSRLYTLSAHKEEPYMPPKGTAADEAELKVIADWINGGLLETKDSKVRKADKPKVDLNSITSTGKPEGPPAMPEHLVLEPEVVTDRPNAVPALAHSPWAPILAVAGQKQVLLVHSQDYDLLGVLPYPEGFPQTLSFSPNGAYLICGGGRAGKSGNVVAWDIKTGERVIEVGKEYDIVLGAGLSPDLKHAVLGGPGRNIKIWDTSSGEQVNSIKKHTDWLLAAAYSPDGVIFATGGRGGDLYVWEAATGYEFYSLKGHTSAITGLSWRADGNVLASCSEDGEVILWEMTAGNQIKKWTAHPGGALSIAYAQNGNLATVGRDKKVKVWQGDGKQLRAIDASAEIILSVALSDDGKRVFTGDLTGQIKAWEVESGKELAQIVQNPPTIEEQLAYSQKRIGDLSGKLPQLENGARAISVELTNAKSALGAKDKALGESKAELAKQQAAVTKEDAAVKSLTPQLAQAQKDLDAKNSAVAALGAEVQTLAANTKALQDKVSGATAAYQKAEAAAKLSTDSLTAAKAEAAKPALAADRKSLHDQATAAQANATKAKTAADAALVAKNQAREALIAAIAAAKAALAQAGTDPAAIAAATAKVAQEEAKMAPLDQERNALTTAQTQAQNVLAEANKALEPLQKEMSAGNERVKSAQTALAAANTAAQTASQTLAAAKAELDKSKAELAAITAKHDERQKALATAKEQAAQSLAAHGAKKKELDDTAARLAAAQNASKAAETALATITKEREASAAKVAEVTKKESETKQAIELVKSDLKESEYLAQKWKAAAINLTAHQESTELETMTVKLEDMVETETVAKTESQKAQVAKAEAVNTLATAEKTVIEGSKQLQVQSNDALEKALQFVSSRVVAEAKAEAINQQPTLALSSDSAAASSTAEATTISSDLPSDEEPALPVGAMAANALAHKSPDEINAEVDALKSRLSELENLLQSTYVKAGETKTTVNQASKVAEETPAVIAARTAAEREAAAQLAAAEAERKRQETALAEQQKLIEELRAKYLATLPEREK